MLLSIIMGLELCYFNFMWINYWLFKTIYDFKNLQSYKEFMSRCNKLLYFYFRFYLRISNILMNGGHLKAWEIAIGWDILIVKYVWRSISHTRMHTLTLQTKLKYMDFTRILVCFTSLINLDGIWSRLLSEENEYTTWNIFSRYKT